MKFTRTLPSLKIRTFKSASIEISSTLLKTQNEIDQFLKQNYYIKQTINKENIASVRLLNQSVNSLILWNQSGIKRIHGHHFLSFDNFLSLLSDEHKEKLSLLSHDDFVNMRLLDVLERREATLEQLLNCNIQDSADFLTFTASMRPSYYWHTDKYFHEKIPTYSLSFENFMQFTPQQRKELMHSSINFWIQEMSIEEFFALPESDRKDLNLYLFVTLGFSALLRKFITVKEFLTLTKPQREASTALFYSDDDHGMAAYQIPYNDKIFNHPSFNLIEFLNLPQIEREEMRERLMCESGDLSQISTPKL